MISDELLAFIEEEVAMPVPMLAPSTIRALLAERAELVAIAKAADDIVRLAVGPGVELLRKLLDAYLDRSAVKDPG
jgi:hypothetical protein